MKIIKVKVKEIQNISIDDLLDIKVGKKKLEIIEDKIESFNIGTLLPIAKEIFNRDVYNLDSLPNTVTENFGVSDEFLNELRHHYTNFADKSYTAKRNLTYEGIKGNLGNDIKETIESGKVTANGKEMMEIINRIKKNKLPFNKEDLEALLMVHGFDVKTILNSVKITNIRELLFTFYILGALYAKDKQNQKI